MSKKADFLMFEPDSRYYKIPNTFCVLPNGKKVGYKQRRFLPLENSLVKLGEIKTTHEERLDIISWKTLGNPKLSWRICDANPDLNAQNWYSTPGEIVQIPKPQV